MELNLRIAITPAFEGHDVVELLDSRKLIVRAFVPSGGGMLYAAEQMQLYARHAAVLAEQGERTTQLAIPTEQNAVEVPAVEAKEAAE